MRFLDVHLCFLAVSVNEVEALFQLYKKISHSIIKDGLIHKVVLQSAPKCDQELQFSEDEKLAV